MADTELAPSGPPAAAEAGTPAEAGPPADEAQPAGEAGEAGEETRSAGASPRQTVLRAAGAGLLLFAFLLLGFAGYLYGLSGVQEARTQTILYTKLQAELAGVQGSVAPVGPTAAGAPVAILNIPAIGVRDMVVVQGTTPENLTAGPGHLPTTPMPGQPGVAEIYGRRATFGGPFSALSRLRAGDTITAITGQGSSTYTVAALALSTKIIQDPAPNRLLLLTASSPAIPSYYVQVDADLTSPVHPSPGVVPAISPAELPLAGDKSALGLTAAWGLALALVSAAGTIAAIRWSPWAAYLATVPLALAVLWNLYQNLAVLLPNLY
jgi:sortase A